jgi:hypothetical protein
MLRRKGLMIAVFTVLGLLILYDLFFFMNKKKAVAAVAPVAATTEGADPDLEVARLAAVKAAQATQLVAAVRVDFPSLLSEFEREPFLFAVEEREGKSMKKIREEAEAEARKTQKTEEPEVLKQLRSLEVSGIVCCDRPAKEATSPGSRVRRLALIGHELVSEGTVLREVPATVVRISETEVELRAGDVSYVLKLAKLSPLGFEVK